MANMKIQLASDLHLERLEKDHPQPRVVAPASDADLLVLAGDIHSGAKAITAFNDWPVPVIYVAGNHEFYGRSWSQTRAELRNVAVGSRVTYLDNDVARFDIVRFLGCTLWTDFGLPGRSRDAWMHDVDRDLDRHGICTDAGPLRSGHLLAEHERSRRWLEAELAKPFDGRTVVVSHHGPHPRSLHQRHAGSPLNAAFVSDLGDLLDGVDLWLHGHVHDSFDYEIGRCRVVANPAGYAATLQDGKKAFENPAFDPALVLELN